MCVLAPSFRLPHLSAMLLNVNFLDDATRPPVPALPNLTNRQRQAGHHLRMIHDHLRDNMKTLAKLIERANAHEVTPAEIAAKANDMAMLANYRRFGNLCGQHCGIVNTHHTIEDHHLFPVLAQQGPAFKAIAERLKAEHVVVHELLEHLVEALNALASEPSPSRYTNARDIYQALERVLLSHLGWEEEAMGDALGYFEIM
ncbi:hypothetical protein VW35_17180 [Devosia soli]|uniref:Hemerythrin-like domain-containing protein n=1 Tax=Devosia soli TaxID=361041 RepID=A0A0F5L2F0_9HYPH|nr:hemerythrin domain-containing protein [Devosia soli]KKB76523.1 hypothetical protein VW35_17180 [Devosia soli]